MKSEGILVPIVAVALTAMISSQFSVIDSWYDTIRPSIAPPNWVFGVVWPALYLMILASFYLAYSRSKSVQSLYLTNLGLQVVWVYAFFSQHNIGLGFVLLIILVVETVVLVQDDKVKGLSRQLMLPYLGWLLFATVLNYLSLR